MRSIALLGRVPPDVQSTLEREVTLVDESALAGMSVEKRAGITHGLTSAVGGASAHVLEMLPGLSVIVSVGAGVDKFDLRDLEQRAITLQPTPDVMTEDTAECAVALLFAVLRNVVINDAFVRRGDWENARAGLGWRISGRRVGIVGLGRIGGRVASKLDVLGCHVSYTGRGKKDVSWRFFSSITALAEAVDVLIMTCAGGEATRGIVAGDVLRALGPKGFLVNVSRGSVVDEAALITALEHGHIAGAALDVFAHEPAPDPRFLTLPNCVLSPHAAVFTYENRRDLLRELRRRLNLTDGGHH